jgi:hypothetical protein
MVLVVFWLGDMRSDMLPMSLLYPCCPMQLQCSACLVMMLMPNGSYSGCCKRKVVVWFICGFNI